MSQEEQTVEANELRTSDETLWRVRQLVSALKPGPAHDAAVDALATADAATTLRKALTRRRTQLADLVKLTTDQTARQSINRSLVATEQQLSDVDKSISGLSGSITELVNAAGEGMAETEIARLRETTGRMTALAEGLRELEHLAPQGALSTPDGTDEAASSPSTDLR